MEIALLVSVIFLGTVNSAQIFKSCLGKKKKKK